jgi:C-terminal processing protease CtpA/Prc
MDLRFNTGGDNSIVRPLERALQDRPALSAPGPLYALIGRLTTSSGMDAAADFRGRLHAMLIGEPLGEKPNTYGEVKNFTLPHSGLVVRYSTKFFRAAPDSDPTSIEPDILVTRSIADFLAGRDPVLDAAVHHSVR